MAKSEFHIVYPRVLVILIYLCSVLTWSRAVNKDGPAHTDNELVMLMCNAQCTALCTERSDLCPKPCNNLTQQMAQGDLRWEMNFQKESASNMYSEAVELVGSCSALKFIKPDSGYIPKIPRLQLWRKTRREITFTWNQDPAASQHEIVYVVVKSTGGGPWRRLVPAQTDTEFTDTFSDFCSNPKYRVAAVSMYGSKWFSTTVQVPVLIPGKPRDIKLRPLTYSRDDTISDIFHFELEWKAPADWLVSDLQVLHKIKPSSWCSSRMSKPVIVIDRIGLIHQNNGSDKSFGMSGKLLPSDIGCKFQFGISAVSRCDTNLVGPPATFSFLLTCDLVPGYKGEYCLVPTVHPPGKVQDVKMTLIPHTNGLIGLVSWQPPTDMGSSGYVEAYHLFYGVVDLKSIIKTFNNPQHMIKSGGSVSADLYFNITTLDAYQSIGVTVMAAGPKQRIEKPQGNIHMAENQIDLPTHNGYVLADGNLFIIGQDQDLSESNFTSAVGVEIFWRRPNPEVRVNLTSIGFSWGLVKTGASNSTRHMKLKADTVEQTTIDSKSHSLSLQHLLPNRTYGIKILNLYDNKSLPSFADLIWNERPTTVFTTPDFNGIRKYSSEMRKSKFNSIPFHEMLSERLSDSVSNLTLEGSEFDNATMRPGIPTEIVTIEPEDFASIIIITVLVAAVIVTVAALIVCFVFRRRREHYKHQHLVSEPTEYRPYTLYRPGVGFSTEDQGESNCSIVADEWELPLSCLKFGPVLGSGAFGNVIRGRVTRAMLTHRGVMHLVEDGDSGKNEQDKLHVTVAIKMLPENCDEKHRRDFQKEIQQMKRIGHHNHVVSILGCCTLRPPLCLVVEHMANGDLLNYLKNIRHCLTSSRAEDQQMYANQGHEPSSTDLLKFAWQITKGMDFLVSKGFVHRDLAARNVLLDSRMTCKIGDFGLTRYMYNDAVYVNRRGGRLPIKWMSVEAIFDMSFSTASDIWSFGIVLFELVTLGGTPYPTIPSRILLKKLKEGYRMERPENCSEEIYEMMMACWREDPTARPSFDALSQWLDSMISEHSGFEYLNMDVNLDRDIYLADEDSEEDDIRVQPEDINEDSDLTTEKDQVLPMTNRGRDLNFTTSSADSGYISAQKCSVSSGESSTTPAPTEMMSASSETEAKHETMDSEMSGKHTFDKGVGEIKEPRGIPEDSFDDVFHEGVAMDTNFPLLSPTAMLTKDNFVTGRGCHNIDGLNADCSEGNDNEGTPCDYLSDVSRIIKRTFSDSLLRRLANFESSDKDNFHSHSPLRKQFSTPLEYPRYGQKVSSRSLTRETSSPALRSMSKRRKAEMRKKRGQRRRRNAIVIPPTLAMDNDFYYTLNKDKQQLPPPTRIPRKICLDVQPETSETYRESKLKPQLRETVSTNIPLAADRDSPKSRRRRKSSIFQYIVFADVHNTCEANGESSDDRHTSFDVTPSDQCDTRPQEMPHSPLVKKTFVKPTDSVSSNNNSLKDERDRTTLGDLLTYQHQYTDFNDILNHIFSPTRWQSPNSRAFIYSSDQCLREQGDKMHKIGSPSESISPHQRSFSEDSALDFYGLDRGGSKDTPPYLSCPGGFSDWVGQTSKQSPTAFGFQDNQENQAEMSPTSLNDDWPVYHPKRRLSDPFSTKGGICSISSLSQSSRNSNEPLMFPYFWKYGVSRFLSLRKRNHCNAANSLNSRSQNLTTEKHPSALYGVKTDVLEESAQTSFLM